MNFKMLGNIFRISKTVFLKQALKNSKVIKLFHAKSNHQLFVI